MIGESNEMGIGIWGVCWGDRPGGWRHVMLFALAREIPLSVHRPLSQRLDRCDRVIQDESGDSNGGNV